MSCARLRLLQQHPSTRPKPTQPSGRCEMKERRPQLVCVAWCKRAMASPTSSSLTRARLHHLGRTPPSSTSMTAARSPGGLRYRLRRGKRQLRKLGSSYYSHRCASRHLSSASASRFGAHEAGEPSCLLVAIALHSLHTSARLSDIPILGVVCHTAGRLSPNFSQVAHASHPHLSLRSQAL